MGRSDVDEVLLKFIGILVFPCAALRLKGVSSYKHINSERCLPFSSKSCSNSL